MDTVEMAATVNDTPHAGAYFWRCVHYFGSMGKRNGGVRNARAPRIAARTDVLRARVGADNIVVHTLAPSRPTAPMYCYDDWCRCCNRPITFTF